MICHKLHPVFAQIAVLKPVVFTKTVGTVQILFIQKLFTEDEDVYKRQVWMIIKMERMVAVMIHSIISPFS